MWLWLLGGIAAVFVLVFLAGVFSAAWFGRENKLNAWARSVPLTEAQQAAMWEVWQAFKAGVVPKIDPLSRLTEAEREYIKEMCSPDHRPAAFSSGRGGDVLRIAQFESALERGYTPAQAAVIVGMTFNKVGRKDI